jgi:serine phosphatase RsbU (regulator of sigma subunit)
MEKLLQAIKKKIKSYKTDLSTNLLSKGVNDIQEFKRVYGYGQGLDKSLEIINETIEKYQKGDIEDDD